MDDLSFMENEICECAGRAFEVVTKSVNLALASF